MSDLAWPMGSRTSDQKEWEGGVFIPSSLPLPLPLPDDSLPPPMACCGAREVPTVAGRVS